MHTHHNTPNNTPHITTRKSPTGARRSARRLGALSLAALAVLAACGSDDDDTVSEGQDTSVSVDAPSDTTGDQPPSDTTGATVPGSTGTATAESCDAYADVSEQLAVGDPAAMEAALDEMVATIPEQWTEQATTVAEGFAGMMSGDETAMLEPTFVSALGYVGGYFVDNCELDTKLEVTGEDYSFTGVPDEIAAGRVGLRLVNASAGNEPHELVILRRPDGDERTIADITTLDPETLFAEYQMAGVAFAEVPASMMSIVVDLERGEYVAICNLPIDGDEAATHAHEGMVVGFTAV